MEDEHLELVNRLFAVATAMLEDATSIAVAGQSAQLEKCELGVQAGRLQAAALDVATIADAAAILAKQIHNNQRPPN